MMDIFSGSAQDSADSAGYCFMDYHKRKDLLAVSRKTVLTGRIVA